MPGTARRKDTRNQELAYPPTTVTEMSHTVPPRCAINEVRRLLTMARMTRGIDYIEPNETGPLHDAVLAGDPDRLHELIERGADVDPFDGRARTPLYRAVLDKKHDAIEALLQAGASSNAQNKDQVTPLHMAALGSDMEVVNCYSTLERTRP